MNVIQERNSAGTPQVTYIRGADLSGTIQGAGGIGGLLARLNGYSSGTGAWSTINSYHADGNGNISAIVNSGQSVIASYRYDPFGGNISSSGTLATANVYRFSSKEIHSPSGLYYYGYRWYDAARQRWINRDPLGEVAGINLYTFVANSPIAHMDWLGLADDGIIRIRPIIPPLPPNSGTGPINGNGNPGYRIGGNNAPPFAPPPGPPCTKLQVGQQRNRKAAGTAVQDCPCTGPGTTVNCTSYEQCESSASFGGYSGPGWTCATSYNWITHRDCTCPEYAVR